MQGSTVSTKQQLAVTSCSPLRDHGAVSAAMQMRLLQNALAERELPAEPLAGERSLNVSDHRLRDLT